MKNNIAITIIGIAMLSLSACQKPAESLELSFNYTRQEGPGSNQYAAWVENSEGQVVRTLYVTSFTAKGRAREGEELVRGYIKRPACVPTWVSRANADSISDEEMDAITGATPSSGIQTFVWDFTDQEGNTVADGSYKVFLEATLFNASTILYSGEFRKGAAPCEIALESAITVEDESHAGMVADVKAALR